MERTNNYNDLKPFRFWCQKVLPLVYDDSLSYYELLDKVIDYLNKTMEDVTVLNDDTEALYAAYNQLQSYVNNYFDNLNVQDEINAKLDQMAMDGTLSSLINPQIPGAVSAWLAANVDPVGSAVVVDSTLTISGAAADAKVTGDLLKLSVDYVDTNYVWQKGTSSGNRYYIQLGQTNTKYKVTVASGLWCALQGFTTQDYSGSAAYTSDLLTGDVIFTPASSETNYYYRLTLGHNTSTDISVTDRANSKVYKLVNILSDDVQELHDKVEDVEINLNENLDWFVLNEHWIKGTSSGNRYYIYIGQNNNKYKITPASGLWVAIQGFTTSDYSGSAAYTSDLYTTEAILTAKSKTTNYYYRLVLGHNTSSDISETDRNNSVPYIQEVANNETVKELDEIVGITEYFFTKELKDSAEKIFEKTKKPCLTYNIITDTHVRPSNPDSVRRTYDSIANMTALNRISYADGVVHLGDTVDHAMYTVDNESDTFIFETMRKYVKRFTAIQEHSYIINGNHDGSKANYYKQYEWYSLCGRLNTYYAEKDGGTNYFYKDYSDIKTRCIFMATPDNVDNEAGAFYGYTYRELHWLVTVALDTPDNYGVIIFSHIPPFFTWYLQNGMRNKDNFYGICNAYHNHTSYTGEIQSANFTNKIGTKIIAMICGHAHGDAVLTAGETVSGVDEHGTPVTTTNEMPCPVICVGAGTFTTTAMSNYGAVAPDRTDKTITQDLWDTMIYRPDLNKIFMVRFGAGNDREIEVN